MNRLCEKLIMRQVDSWAAGCDWTLRWHHRPHRPIVVD